MQRLLIVAAAMLPVAAVASECALRATVVAQSAAVIAERGEVVANVVNGVGGKKCVVSFRARVDAAWHVASGEQSWDGRSPPESACSQAVSNAEKSLVESLSPVRLNSEQIMICNDRESLQTQPLSEIGVRANLDQFRVHPKYPRVFWHNGTECRWTLDTVFEKSRVETYQGIICKVSGNQWVLVDRF